MSGRRKAHQLVPWVRYTLGLLFILCTIAPSVGQSFTTEDYYLFPINPGGTNYLAGTMGEMRGTHFHGGIDIRTGGRIGLPVYAAADGYISRARVQAGGFGHVLYMQHPNGTTSVYAHLDRFAPHLEEYLISNQYRREKYFIDLFPPSDRFTFRQGEIIAYSGNTGSSSGPHLHFEIRDPQARVLDPLKFGFKEVTDNIRPTLQRVAFVSLDGDARINGAFGRYEFTVDNTDEGYRLTKPLVLEGRVGIEMQYLDRHNGSSARNGIPEIILTMDSDTVFHQKKTNISYGEMRNIIVHMNYPTYARKRRKFNKLYRDDGNQLSFYLTTNDGLYFDEAPRDLELSLIDSYGNVATFTKSVNQRKIQYPITPEIARFELQGNYLHLQSSDSLITVDANALEYKVAPYHETAAKRYFLWDLRKGLPDTIFADTRKMATHFQTMVPSGQEFQFFNPDINLSFGPRDLFDTLYLRFEKEETLNEEIFRFRNRESAFRQNVEVTLRPKRSYSDQSHVYVKSGRNYAFKGGKWDEGTVQFLTRDLGTYTIKEDTTPPQIRVIRLDASKLIFRIGDDLSGVASYKATLNGDWLLLKYDAKRSRLESADELNKSFDGEFILEVTDNAGNTRIYQKTISNS
ncbi:MAG: M23 family metallopeptidase [Bacteroidota bacterium]